MLRKKSGEKKLFMIRRLRVLKRTGLDRGTVVSTWR